MRQVVTYIAVTCDLDGAKVPDTEAREIEFSWDGKTYVLDTCNKHVSITSTPIGVLIEAAREVKPAKKKPGPNNGSKVRDAANSDFYAQFLTEDETYLCDYVDGVYTCGFNGPTPGSLGTHYKRTHGVNIKEAHGVTPRKR